jgi:transposase
MSTASVVAPAAQPSVGAAQDAFSRRARSDRNARILKLAGDGRSAYAIAREVGCSDTTVRSLLHAFGAPVRAAACSLERRALSAERRAQAIALYEAGLSFAEVGQRLGVGTTQVGRYLHDAGVPARRPGASEQFTAAGNEATREMVRERNRRAHELALWTRQEAADFLVLRLPSLVYLEREGLLEPVTRLELGARTFPLYEPRDVKLFARERRRSADHRVRMHRTPEAIRRWARTRGYSRRKVDELAERAADRASREKRLRTAIASAEERHARWRRLCDQFRLDYPDDSMAALCRAVFDVDWQEHPEDWPREKYPPNRQWRDVPDGRFARTAAMRIRNALQNA